MLSDFSSADDTSPAVKNLYYQRLASLSPEERLDRCLKLCEMVRALTLAGIMHRCPNASAGEIKARFASLTGGRVACEACHDETPPQMPGD